MSKGMLYETLFCIKSLNVGDVIIDNNILLLFQV
jgi:hypothetical protein